MASRVNQPDQAPDPDGGHDLQHSFGKLEASSKTLEEAIRSQTVQMAKWISLQARYAGAGEGHAEGMGQAAMAMQYRPRIQESVLSELTAQGAIPNDPTMGMTKMTKMGALTSLQNAQAYTAQRFGQWITGTQKLGIGRASTTFGGRWAAPGHVPVPAVPGWL